jgi:hypothetical protein
MKVACCSLVPAVSRAGTIGEQRAQRKRQAGRVQHFNAGRADDLGQALPAKLDRMLNALPPRLRVGAKRFDETRAGGDHTVLKTGGLQVGWPVERRHHALVELCTLFEDRRRSVETRVFKTGQLRDRINAGNMLKRKQDVFQRNRVTHVASPGAAGGGSGKKAVTRRLGQPSS